MDLQDKVIVITGAGRGLGRAMAIQMAEHDAKLVLIDLNQDELDTTAAMCEDYSATVKTYLCDITDEALVESVFAQIKADLGAVSALINNAGITRDSLFVKAQDGQVIHKMSKADFDAVVDVNLAGTFLCTREATVQMIEAEHQGCIINISSISRHGNVGQTNYTASKAAVAAMTVTWMKELARYGIRVNAIAPGFIATDMVKAIKPTALAKLSAAIPLQRLGKPEEIARTVCFILNNDYINGRVIEVDGGLRI